MTTLDKERPAQDIDPDPLSALVIALGAVGSIASIYAVVDSRVSKYRQERQANCNAIRDAVMGVETSLNELRGYVKSLEISFLTGTQSRSPDRNSMLSMAQFGSVRLVFTRDGYERWREIEEGILVAVGRMNKHVNDLIRHFATSDIALPSEIASRLQNTIGRMNEILHGMSQMHFERLFGLLEAVMGECMDSYGPIQNDHI